MTTPGGERGPSLGARLTANGGLLAALFLAGLAAGLAVLHWAPPATWPARPFCPLWVGLGVYCPGCGTGRALTALAHGQVLDAVSYNVMLVVGLPFVALYLWDSRRPRPWFARHPRLGWWVLALFVGYALLRNLPWPPFTVLAPHPWGSL